jgi:pimeloyl-ACP methyl ester carboxylesterase
MQTIILLHGAIGAASQLSRLADALSSDFRVFTFDFPGHGGKDDGGAVFSMEFFADAVLSFMADQGLEKASIFGYSMGGYVGMFLAKHHPDKIEKVITLATKFQWDEAIAANEVKMLNPDKIEQKLPAFAESLRAMHAPFDWKALLHKTADLLTALGKDNTLKPTDYSSITTPALLMLGDRDKMVTLEETLAVYKTLPNAKLGVLPGTPHPIDQVDTGLLAFLIKGFVG